MNAGQQVRFTTGDLGLIETPSDNRFQEEMISAGDVGVYVGKHPSPALAAEDWHLVKVEVGGRTLYAPVHRGHITEG